MHKEILAELTELDRKLYKFSIKYIEAIYDELLPKNYPELANSYGHAELAKCNTKNALCYEKELLSIIEKTCSHNRLAQANSCSRISFLLSKKPDSYLEALKYGLRALEHYRVSLPDDVHQFALSHYMISNIYLSLKNDDEAVNYRLKAIELYEIAIPEKHSTLANMYSNIANLLSKIGRFEDEIICKERAVSFYEMIYPKDSLEIANKYLDVGKAYWKINQIGRAYETYLKAVPIFELAFRELAPELALLYSDFGVLCGEFSHYDEALRYGLMALNIRERLLSSDHADIVLSYNNIGYAYIENEEYELAIDFLQRGLTIISNNPSQEYNFVCNIYANLGIAYSRLNLLVQAKENLLLAKPILKEQKKTKKYEEVCRELISVYIGDEKECTVDWDSILANKNMSILLSNGFSHTQIESMISKFMSILQDQELTEKLELLLGN